MKREAYLKGEALIYQFSVAWMMQGQSQQSLQPVDIVEENNCRISGEWTIQQFREILPFDHPYGL